MPRFYPQRTVFFFLYVGLIFWGCKLLISSRTAEHFLGNKQTDSAKIVVENEQEEQKTVREQLPITASNVTIQQHLEESVKLSEQKEIDTWSANEDIFEEVDLPDVNGDQVVGVKHLKDNGNVPGGNFSSENVAKRTTTTEVPVKELDGSELNNFDGEPYPKLSQDGKFLPVRKVVHFDLKGAPLKPEYFIQLFPILKDLGATSILMEWEDMFPYTGSLSNAKNLKSYTASDVNTILSAAASSNLEIIPLIQTFGHLEWILKLKEFAHLRENPRIPQVICFGLEESWTLISEMLDEVVKAHKPFGLPFFHIGADEAFEIGLCEADRLLMRQENGKQRLILWHIARIARYLREKHNTRVLAWHDMFFGASSRDLKRYQMTQLVEPVVWNYAEDLNTYLRPHTWTKLNVFPYVWGASSFKGADGPSRYYSNPSHYVANHRSWMNQMNMNYYGFKQFRGIIMTGWSRFDHMAVLCEILPVGFPSLAYNLLTLDGLDNNYQLLQQQFSCRMMPQVTVVRNCAFPGAKIYELVQEIKSTKESIERNLHQNYEYHGWLSRTAHRHSFSSGWYLNHLTGKISGDLFKLEEIKKNLKREMEPYFYSDAVNEFIFQYLDEDLELLRKAKETSQNILAKTAFPLRPFPELLATEPTKSL